MEKKYSIKKHIYWAIAFAMLVTFMIEAYNWARGFTEFSFIRELLIYTTNFVIGLLASFFYIKK